MFTPPFDDVHELYDRPIHEYCAGILIKLSPSSLNRHFLTTPRTASTELRNIEMGNDNHIIKMYIVHASMETQAV